VNPMIPGRHPETSAPYLLQPGEYGAFLCRLFDEWASTEHQRVMVSPLNLYLEAILGGVPYECQQQGTCAGSHLGVKPSRDAVPCSRFGTHLCNIHDCEIEAWSLHLSVRIFGGEPKPFQSAMPVDTGQSATAGAPSTPWCLVVTRWPKTLSAKIISSYLPKSIEPWQTCTASPTSPQSYEILDYRRHLPLSLP
jgi:hypothetical protein